MKEVYCENGFQKVIEFTGTDNAIFITDRNVYNTKMTYKLDQFISTINTDNKFDDYHRLV